MLCGYWLIATRSIGVNGMSKTTVVFWAPITVLAFSATPPSFMT